jgi:hypothetical protein
MIRQSQVLRVKSLKNITPGRAVLTLRDMYVDATGESRIAFRQSAAPLTRRILGRVYYNIVPSLFGIPGVPAL